MEFSGGRLLNDELLPIPVIVTFHEALVAEFGYKNPRKNRFHNHL